jgi:hypothetical protein
MLTARAEDLFSDEALLFLPRIKVLFGNGEPILGNMD